MTRIPSCSSSLPRPPEAAACGTSAPLTTCTTDCGTWRARCTTSNCWTSNMQPISPGQILRIQDIRKCLPDGRELLKGVSLDLNQGDFIGLLGPSGAGKSLTIRCTLALTRPTSGEVVLRGRDGRTFSMERVSGKRLREARAEIGVIFQGLHLVKRLSVLENVMIGRLGRIHPLRSWFYGFTDREAAEAFQVLEGLGLGEFAGRVSSTLSGGELQR